MSKLQIMSVLSLLLRQPITFFPQIHSLLACFLHFLHFQSSNMLTLAQHHLQLNAHPCFATSLPTCHGCYLLMHSHIFHAVPSA